MSILVLINLSKARVPLRIIFLLILIIFPFVVKAEKVVATGFSSVTEGRTVPLFNFGYDSPTSAFLFHSVGVSNDIYYHNSYMLSGFRQVDLDDFWWGKVRAGLGGGLHYAQRGYEDGDKKQSASDFSLGPSVRVTWEIFPYCFVGIESFFGLGSFQVFVLSTQQISLLTFGVRF